MFDQVAEDQFERVIARRTGVQEIQGIGESDAVAAAELAGGPG
jgi:hypothetical protein